MCLNRLMELTLDLGMISSQDVRHMDVSHLMLC